MKHTKMSEWIHMLF